jgi:putative phosphoesterase
MALAGSGPVQLRVGVISDTHGLLRPRVLELFEGVDHILHAGDIGDEEVLIELRALAPVTAVAGNVDGFSLGGAGREARVELGGTRFFLTHILDRPQRLLPEVERSLQAAPAEVVIFGHSHLPHDERRGGRWYFNPASAGPRRFDYPCAVGLLELRDGSWSGRHLGLDARSEQVLASGKHQNQLSRGAPADMND